MSVPVIQAKLPGKWNGFATPFFIVVEDKTNPKLIAHEMAHVKQWWKGLIFGFPFVYLYQIYKYGYENAPLELEAREAASRVRP